ncbi:sigma-70 family RNA polymerase sigma factor [Aerococcaceae bacterium zg-ZJ1578]|uniref:hypothetical protein n=1 Tax=Aerococcaceae bacterium zg-252 TaxID=2796928 RepID=UPI001A24E80E|nr:sigma-70 family RNA polymerase sigma factor [Aerococcaceae bacterium zg-1578]
MNDKEQVIVKQFLNYVKIKIHYKKIDLLREKKKNYTIELEENVVLETKLMEPKFLVWESAIQNDIMIDYFYSIPEDQQILIWLIFVEQFSQKEISNVLEISQSKLSKLKSKHLKVLKSMMKKESLIFEK